MRTFLFSVFIVLLSSPALADDILYSYCLAGEDTPHLQAGSLLLLSFNLSTSEEALFVKEDKAFNWMAGRKPPQTTAFGTSGSLRELSLALDFRETLHAAHFRFGQFPADVNHYPISEPETCLFSFHYINNYLN